MNRIHLLLLALMACGLLAAACGDDDGGGADSEAPAKTESIPSEPTDSGPSETPPAVSDAATEQAVESCKQNVQTAGGQLSDDTRSDLEQLCEDAAEGDEEEVRKASVELCERVAREAVPEGPAQQQALAACKQAQAP